MYDVFCSFDVEIFDYTAANSPMPKVLRVFEHVLYVRLQELALPALSVLQSI